MSACHLKAERNIVLCSKTNLEHVGLQFAPFNALHTLISDMNFHSGERGLPDIAFSGKYTGVFLEVLIQNPVLCGV